MHMYFKVMLFWPHHAADGKGQIWSDTARECSKASYAMSSCFSEYSIVLQSWLAYICISSPESTPILSAWQLDPLDHKRYLLNVTIHLGVSSRRAFLSLSLLVQIPLLCVLWGRMNLYFSHSGWLFVIFTTFRGLKCAQFYCSSKFWSNFYQQDA